MDEVDNERSGHGKGNKDNEPESIRFSIEGEIIVLKVHAIGREDHGWDGHDDGHHGQGFMILFWLLEMIDAKVSVIEWRMFP